jgi:prepilin-type N-terminal cleavage/methylation domain-containing protein/prepilin-type processing-associated H-X9-DG protein
MAQLTHSRGFTLVELLVVITVIALLVAIAVPVVSRLRGNGQSTKCLSNLRQLGVALNAYLADHDGTMPTLAAGRASSEQDAQTIDTVLLDYAGDRAVFRCPSDPAEWKRSGTSYYWDPALNGQRAAALNFLDLTQATTGIPVLSDKEGWHSSGGGPKVNILYADGHAGRGLELNVGN